MSEEYDPSNKFGYPEKWDQVEFVDESGRRMTGTEFMDSIGLERPEGGWGDGPPDASEVDKEAAED